MPVIGIMQGRLSPPREGRIQSFPVETWEEEFPKAREAGLDCIEWIYEKETEERNPLASDEGTARIRELAGTWSVGVHSICADYYMTEQLIDARGEVSRPNLRHLAWLMGCARRLGARYIILPFVDASSLRRVRRSAALKTLLEMILPEAERSGIEIHLETDLPPDTLIKVLREIDHRLIRANYDIGNSASLGYDPQRELTLLGEYIGSVHVKDRVLGGGSVPLGEGAADFPLCFRLLAESGYGGSYILQAARGADGDEVGLAARNRMFVLGHLASLPT
ncbi:MAG: sugar phosphate isomerase/epimerase [Methanomicrobiales archaeon]|nr:sugar phosphate isomerase/epimerase [Methanomicrobiales archaeon]